MQLNAIEDHDTALDDLQLFLQAAHNISCDMHPDHVVEAIIEESCKILSCDRASLFMVDDEYLTLVLAKGANNIRLPRTQGIAGYAATNKVAVNIRDAHLDDRFDPSFDLKSGYRTKAVLACPVYDVDGEMVAIIQAINKKGKVDYFAEKDLLLLENFAKHASVALNNAYVYERALDAERRLSSLIEMITALHGDTQASSLIFTLSHRSHQLVGADRCTLYLLDQDKSNLCVMQGDVDIRFPSTVGIAGYVATEGELVNIPDCYEDDRFNQSIDKKTGYHTKAMLCMPIFDHNKETIGVLQVINKLDGSEFTDEDEKLLTIMLSIAGPVLEKSAVRKTLRSKKKVTSDKRPDEIVAHKHTRGKKYKPPSFGADLPSLAE